MRVFRFSCFNCGEVIEAAPDHADLKLECPHCAVALMVSNQMPRKRAGRTQKSTKNSGLVIGIVFSAGIVFVTIFVLLDSDPQHPNSGLQQVDEAVVEEVIAPTTPQSKIPNVIWHEDTPLTLSKLKECQAWRDFVSDPIKNLQLFNQGGMQREIGPEHFTQLYAGSYSRRPKDFHENIAFCQQIASSGDNAERLWAERFERWNIASMDEFSRRDFIDSERNAARDILKSLPNETPFILTTHWIYKIGEYDFRYQCFPISTDDSIEDAFGFGLNGAWRSWDQQLFMIENQGKGLRVAGISFLCVRVEFDMGWNNWSPHNQPKKIFLNEVDLPQFASPKAWSLRLEGTERNLLVLHPSGSMYDPKGRGYLSFRQSLVEYDKWYQDTIFPHYGPFSAVKKYGMNLSADFHLQMFDEKNKRRDISKLQHVFEKRAQIEQQKNLTALPPEVDKLLETYLNQTWAGWLYVNSETPQEGAKFLDPWLNSQPQIESNFKELLRQIDLLLSP